MSFYDLNWTEFKKRKDFVKSHPITVDYPVRYSFNEEESGIHVYLTDIDLCKLHSFLSIEQIQETYLDMDSFFMEELKGAIKIVGYIEGNNLV